MIGRIYIIKNTVNDKVYIGQTINTVENRFYAHKLNAKEGAKTKLYKAMYSIGIEKFYVDTLVECEITPSELTLLERMYILKFNSIDNGYNSVIPIGSHFNNRDFTDERNEEIIDDYKNGLSYNDMCSKYNISKTHISRICSQFKNERNRNFSSTNKRKPVVAYDKESFTPVHIFESIREAFIFLNNNNINVTKGGAYYYIEQSCQIGSIAYGYRWQLLSDLIYDNKIFRTKFDKEAYINGSTAYKQKDKYYLICDNSLNKIQGLRLNRSKCIDCGKIIFRHGRCIDCYKMLVHNINIGEDIRAYKCIICGNNKALKINSMCNSCANVAAKGKSPKPTKEQLKEMLESGLQVKQIAEMYGRTHSTICYWIKNYKLK